MLILKKFIIPFESGVVVIKHWKIHNYIQNDRYKETVYKDEKKLLVTDENKVYSPLENAWIQDGYSLDTQDRIGKASIGEASKELDTLTSGDEAPASMDYQSIMDSFNRICTSQPKIKSITEPRKKAIKRAAKTLDGNGEFEALFQKVERSDFLSGRVKKWTCGFDWILKPANLTKILEGNYDEQNGAAAKLDYTDTSRYENTGWED